MTTPDEDRACAIPDVERQRSAIADTTPGLVVEAERLPDGRRITYFSVWADA